VQIVRAGGSRDLVLSGNFPQANCSRIHQVHAAAADAAFDIVSANAPLID
jgi:hypothetical protein